MPQRKPQSGGRRSDRVGDAIHRELAALLQREIKDPRLRELNLTQVDVTGDLSHAKVYVSHVEGVAVWPDAERALRKASGFLRSQLAHVLNTYSVPQLQFVFDESLSRGAALSALIERAVAEDSQHPPDPDVGGDAPK
jgi:ribosome-binding factor A